ncbi:copper amine oxidase N-terminal domain-containing protein [Sedimentibacter sp.]|uniref:copper amine oxidase N-terminal domain-containing protein n=1 Tax=Sedimentibacter sp. TaxID=1960295 RepID=UPI0028AC1774|nr:copper amine oxidase N-terminal domain-containing protein [Sedimentibacter sp.]
MVKRKISLLIAVLMLFSMLTGCTVNELGYLNMSSEINKLTQYEFKNSTQIEISKIITGTEKDTKIDLEISGEANIDDINEMYLNMDIKVKVDGKGTAEPVKLIMANNKFYISKNAIAEALRLQEELGSDDYNALIVEKLLEELKDTDYIVVAEMDDVYGSVSYKENYTVLLESAKEYLSSAFKGFDSKLIKKTSNGYSMELTAENAVEFVERLIKYISENKELVFDETIKYLENIYAAIEINGIEGTVETEEIIAELEGMREGFYETIDEVAAYLETGEHREYIDMLDRSYIKNEIYKKGSVYGQTIDGELVFEGIIAGNIKSESEIAAKTVKKVSVADKAISVEELENLYDALENKYNPIETIEISWYEHEAAADVSMYRADGKYDWDYQPYVIIEGRVYLPLRYIGETFGEEVQWDDANKKAYVIRGSEKIDMTGVLVDGRTMVKVRDFEKLGYVIGYEQFDDYSTATITKK